MQTSLALQETVPTTTSPEERAPPPGLLGQFGSRFAIVFLLLITLPGPIILLPGFTWLNSIYEWPWNWLATHLGPILVGGPVKVGRSVDALSGYLSCGMKLAAAIPMTAAWVWLRRSSDHDRLVGKWFRVYLRYDLAGVMLAYGFSKVFHNQFPALEPYKLIEPLGQMSPMGLLWAFMGYSKPYSVFGGLAEVFGSVLLFSRRTATLGALILAAVLTNVVMLNLCYDIPVKLWSSLLLLMALFLVSRDARRLANVLVFNRPTARVPELPLVERPWARRAAIAVKVLFVVVLVSMPVLHNWMRMKMTGDAAQPGAFHGLYEVLPAASPDRPLARQWKRLAVGKLNFAVLQGMDDDIQRFALRDDPARHRLGFWRQNSKVEEVSYRWLDPQTLELKGTWDGEPLGVRLRRQDPKASVLLGRGFHWVNEEPFHR